MRDASVKRAIKTQRRVDQKCVKDVGGNFRAISYVSIENSGFQIHGTI